MPLPPSPPDETPWPAGAGEVAREDEALVRRLQAREEEAFLALVERYHGSMLRLARSVCRTPAVAEEVVQETWEAVLEGLPSFQGRSSLKTWLFRILLNRARTRAGRERRSVPLSALAAGEEGTVVDPERFGPGGMWAVPPAAWPAETPEELVHRQEVLQHLAAALETLPASQRAVVVLRDVEGLGAQEVCQLLDVSEANQRVLLHRGRAKLRTALEEHLGRPG
jgi:RNA polymerase sigma-70 factor (ECF subfamily)